MNDEERGKSEAARKGGRCGARGSSAYPVDELPPELQILADVALRVVADRRVEIDAEPEE